MANARQFMLLQIFFSFSVLTVISDTKKPIDLTRPFNLQTIAWSGTQPFVFRKQITQVQPNGQWYSSNEFSVSEHAGTHLDAPYHSDKFGWKVGDIPLSRLVGNGIKIDLSNETEKLDHAARLLPQHLIDWEKEHGPIPENAIVLVYFNWGRHYHDATKYLGGKTANEYKFPGVSVEAAQWLADSGKVLGVGLDTASVDPGNAIDLPAHGVLGKKQIYNLENVKIPQSLSEKGYKVFVMPMLIGEGTGAPVRIVAYPENK